MKTHVDGSVPIITKNVVFVFGSNEAGMHGAGAAKEARKNFGAIEGLGAGLSNHSYAIPTKDRYIRALPLDKIKRYVYDFVEFTHTAQYKEFFITRVGCDLDGFHDDVMAPLFLNVNRYNCSIATSWLIYF